MSNTVYKGTLPPTGREPTRRQAEDRTTIPTVAQIQTQLNQLMQHVNVGGADSRATSPGSRPTRSASRPSTTAACSATSSSPGTPRTACRSGSRSTPAATARPVLELKATQISYGAVSRQRLQRFSAPSRRKVVKVSPGRPSTAPRSQARARREAHAQARRRGDRARPRCQAQLPFTLAAPEHARRPAAAVGARCSTGAASPAALVTYGQGLGGIAVIEQTAARRSRRARRRAAPVRPRGLSLPTVSINGATGQELATALGTVVRVHARRVAYTVLGSVPPTAAEAAARALAPTA